MGNRTISKQSFCVLSGISGIAGTLMLVLSFVINPGPPRNADSAERP